MNKKITAIILALCLSACATGLIGCKRVVDSGKPRVALVMKSLANEFFKTMEDGAKGHHKANSAEYELVTVGIRDELDVAQQIKLVESMIAQQVNAIVIAPADSIALIPVCKKAIQAGITVVNIDNKFDDEILASRDVKIPFVGPDNRKGATLAGDYLAKKLTKGDKVAIIEGAPNAFNAIQRKLGFEDAMKRAGMNIVSSQTAYWETDRANKVASAMIVAEPQLKAILCANDSMVIGALAAVKAAGKTGDILTVGFDNIAAVQRALKEGRILCTVDQHADKLAVFGIEYALEMLSKGGTPKDRETAVDLITAEKLK
ncbi:MAG: sugar ABC transporter substrate-binding protein [Planctomycetes bacterium]|nr:sugar ABC transporter substrate-binding protein [Planctomycetota bacterium]